MGCNPFRPHRRSAADYVMVVAALAVCAALVAWGRVRVIVMGLWDDDGVTVRRVQPYEARKTYVCPGCNQDIPPGMGHVVAVPDEAPDLHRHWHRGCWDHRDRRRPGRMR